MTVKVAPISKSNLQKVEADVIRVSKDVIELITSGMYLSPVTIFREYLQNSADAIDSARAQGLIGKDDSGRASIVIDHASRSLMIRDEGAGIPSSQAVQVLVAIGGSPKRGSTARGFRGVGRLSGLAYCRELEFRTKAAGEAVVSTVTWDCRLLRGRLADGTFSGDVRRIISEAVSVQYTSAENVGEHFFEVHMRDVARHRNDMLLNEQLISRYLGQVGPVSFDPAFSSSPINEHLKKHGAYVPPVSLIVQAEPVYRPYRDKIPVPGTPFAFSIDAVELLEFADVDGHVGAVGWLGHHEYVRSIPTALGIRGLRARVGDVQIGEGNLFEDVFRETRFNGWTVGEIHVLDRRIVPNARRDNFEVNHHSYNLLAQIGPITAKIAHLCRSSSVSRNNAQIARKVITEVDHRVADERALDPAEASRYKSAILRAQAKLKNISDESLRKDLTAELDRALNALSERKTSNSASVVGLAEALALVSKTVTNRDQAQQLATLLRQLSE